MATKILLADDHEIVLEGIRTLMADLDGTGKFVVRPAMAPKP